MMVRAASAPAFGHPLAQDATQSQSEPFPPSIPVSRVANMRSVQTSVSTHAHRARISPSCGALSGTVGGLCSCVLSFTLPPSCLPLLHGHYPASALLRRLCHLSGTVLRTLCQSCTPFLSRIVIPDSCRSNFRPFYLHPPHALLNPTLTSRRRSGRGV